MQLHVVIRRIRLYWKKRWIRVLVLLLVLSAAVVVDLYLSRVPLPVEVSDTTKVKLPPVRLGDKLVIGDPVIETGKSLLAHYSDELESLDIDLSEARIEGASAETNRIDKQAAERFGRISYRPKEPEKPPVSQIPCRTGVEVFLLPQGQSTPKEIRFWQSTDPGADHYRYLGANADVDLKVVLSTDRTSSKSDAVGVAIDGPGCLKRLAGDGWEKIKLGLFKVNSYLAKQGKLGLRFTSRVREKPLWNGKDGLLEPFTMASPILKARKVTIESAGTTPLQITSSGKEALQIERLKVGSDQLLWEASGRGYVTIDGEPVVINFFDRLQAHPFLSGLFLMANAALLGWLVPETKRLFKAQ